MSELRGALTAERSGDSVREEREIRVAKEPLLAIFKLQVLVDDPDRWFERTFGITPPPALREVEMGSIACAWLAPGEWLITGLPAEVEQVRLQCETKAGHLGLVIDLTHARAVIEVSGGSARDVIASHCPLDLSEKEMPVGAAMRSLFSDVGLFITRRPDRDGRPSFRLIVDQTMGAYAARMLDVTVKSKLS